MRIRDDRTPEEKTSHTWLVIGTDKFMSGWAGGVSIAAWACRPVVRERVLAWVKTRSDMVRVREVSEALKPYKPRGNGDCHIYVITADVEERLYKTVKIC